MKMIYYSPQVTELNLNIESLLCISDSWEDALNTTVGWDTDDYDYGLE